MGTITSYEPDGFIGMDFHIPAPGETVKEKTRVEVRFTALGDNQTCVELMQSDWEALGPRAGDIRGGYGKGWTMIFERAYKAACGG